MFCISLVAAANNPSIKGKNWEIKGVSQKELQVWFLRFKIEYMNIFLAEEAYIFLIQYFARKRRLLVVQLHPS